MACGFTPVYGIYAAHNQPQSVVQALNDIYIETIPDRSGQKLRNHLIDRLVQSGGASKSEATYTLTVASVSEKIYGINIAKDDTATRSQIRLNTSFTLKRDGQIILSRTASAVSSFNILSSQYTTLVTQEAARGQTIEQLSDQIITQLELYFSNPAAFPKP
jgi:LPS-assembly lipoprotein